MRLIFIRHAEPDYEHNCLTEKGYREAEILAGRVATWDKDRIREILVSPIPRAQMTAAPSLQALGMEATTYEWLKEFSYATTNPRFDRLHVPWDLPAEYFAAEEKYVDYREWLNTDYYRENPDLAPAYEALCTEVDAYLSGYGYVREGRTYRVDPVLTKDDEDDMVIAFCHFGVTNFILGHMLSLSPAALCMQYLSSPTGITVVNAEKSDGGYAMWRVQYYGDVAHLREAGEEISYMASWSPVFQG